MLADSFETFVESLQLKNEDDIDIKYRGITKRLNMSYYADNKSEEDHAYKVGSLGRQTAINGISDMDMLFVLPDCKYKQYNNYSGNGQSALLQDVKKELKKKYTNEKIKVRGDGQVVVIKFSNYMVEVCPAFENSDGSYKYPDSNNGGVWRRTDPLVEMGESDYMISCTNYHFQYICQMIRAWKNNMGFKMGGLLIDTLVYKFFNKYPDYMTVTYDDYFLLFKDLFAYLKGQSKEKKYWQAMGSRQPVYDKSKAFIDNAQKAHDKLKDLSEESEEVYQELRAIFGTSFPIPQLQKSAAEMNSLTESYSRSANSTEQFIEDLFPIDIKYSLKIECSVEADGFREGSLRSFISRKMSLGLAKSLKFYIEDNEIEDKLVRELSDENFDIYWKVRNKGIEAIKRDCIRGQITRGTYQKTESTSFAGGHFVECYIVYNGICVAKDRIEVPIRATASHPGVHR